MRKASRYMPEYTPSKPSFISLGVGLLVLGLLCFFYIQVLYVIIGLVVFVSIWAWIDTPRVKAHYDEMFKSRESLSICTFAREFDCHEVDTWIIRAVYEELQEFLPTNRTIPIKASDSLKDDLGLDDDDLDMDLAGIIAQRTGRSFENYEANPYYGKVITVRDLVLFFNNQPKINAT